MITAEQLIRNYKLEKHPEGGCFAEVYTSNPNLGMISDARPLAGSIYFLLPYEAVSHFHQIDCEEIWYYHAGCGMKLYLITSDGKLETKKLGLNHDNDAEPMLIIPKGTIFAAENVDAESFTFVSCVTVPKFRYSGFRLVTYAEMQAYGIERRLCIQ